MTGKAHPPYGEKESTRRERVKKKGADIAALRIRKESKRKGTFAKETQIHFACNLGEKERHGK